jgi:hypothetical protein
MHERNVTESEIEAVMAATEYIELSVKGRMNAFHFINDRYLRITFREETDHILIITVTIRKKPFKE